MILKKNNLKENDTLLIAEKIKNTGTISLTKIISNQNTDFEKYLSISSEYLNLQSKFDNLKKEFLNYLEGEQWNEIILTVSNVARVIKKIKDENWNLLFKTKILDSSEWLNLLVKGEKNELIKFWEFISDLLRF
ncbi:MAG: hypothetical protein H9Q65_03255 [Spiroplasma ixodetis]|nr:hypothetical protein [Spiroplasma ixodetis]MBP1526588.1 hypothetical protein [Spiroplasma ixodetis]MBP1528254.1 hypothetical protein [Spiroplasma ixodetis]